jgi:hypothetical protein
MEMVCYAQSIIANFSNSVLVLVDGDSGSWVVKQDTHEVVGQIVATDILGAAYIIPLCDIFDDICKSLGAAAVSLPVPSDIAAIKTLASQVSASNDDFEMLLKDEKSDSPLNEPGAKHYVTHNDYNPLISRQNSNGVETLSHDKNQILGNHVVMSKIRNLVEYYFSVENLSKDMHLRRHMDSQGYVPLLFVAAFKRMRELCPDPAILSAVCDESFDIDYVVGDDDCERLRRHDGWEIWILPWDQRDELARNNGAMCVTFKSNRDRQASPGRGFSKIKQYLEKDSFETSAQQQILVAVADTLRISPDDILPSYSFPALGGDEKAAQKLEDRLQKQGIGINADDAMRCRTIAELQTCARPLRSSASYSTSDLQSADSAASSNYSQQTEDHMSDKPLKGIFKQSKPSFPEPQDSTREVVAPAKDDKKLKEAPARARWTKISRAVVNPEALTMGKERYEVQDDFVVVLSVLSKGEIQAYAALTQALRGMR